MRHSKPLMNEPNDLQAPDDRFRLLVESAPTAIIMVDQTGTILLANPEVERTFGYNRQELIRKPVELLVPDSARSGHPGQLQAFFRKPERRSMGAGRDLTGRRKDGTEVPIEIALNPIQTSEGPCVLAFIADITERRTSERRRSAEAAVLTLLNDQLSWKDSIPRILAAIGSSIGWSAAAYWQVQASNASIRCEEFWSTAPQIRSAQTRLSRQCLRERNRPSWQSMDFPRTRVDSPPGPEHRVCANRGRPEGWYPLRLRISGDAGG